MESTPERPALTGELTGDELVCWYWTKDELAGLARRLGLSAGGHKRDLTERVRAALDGRPPPAPASVRTRPRTAQLSEPMDESTVIPPGQRCSQALRSFFLSRLGRSFHFDAFMREFIAEGAGRTLGEALQHWQATRDRAALPGEIGPQFEFNRFLRDWHRRNPGSTHGQAIAAWRQRRAMPSG